MRYPRTIKHYNHKAKVYKAKDGYHVSWHQNGKRCKRQFQKAKEAECFAKEILKKTHKGQGAAASLSKSAETKLMNAPLP